MTPIKTVFFAAFAVVLAGCSSIPLAGGLFSDDEDAASEAEIADLPEVPAGRILNAGIRNANLGDARKAQRAFEEIEKQHPFSQEAQRAIVLSAFTHFEEGEYDETVAKAQRFIQLYPGSNDVPYMYYLIGESYFNRVNAVSLDQSDTEKGLRAYSDLVRLFPDSVYTEDAKRKKIFMNDQLAGKEMQIGRYYQEKRHHLAAVNRFRSVVSEYQTTRHIEEALYRLTESYLALGIVGEAQTSAALLGHNYPDSEWYLEAFNLLTGENLEPRLNRRSTLVGLIPFVGSDDDEPQRPQQASTVSEPIRVSTPAQAESEPTRSRGISRFIPFVGSDDDDE